MQADKTTLTDLSIFNIEEEQSVFHYLNFTRTIGGKEWLRYFLNTPFSSIKDITETQLQSKLHTQPKASIRNVQVYS